MFHRDYLMRMIEQMSQFIGQVIFKLKKEEKFEEALQEIDELLHRLFLPKGNVLRTISVQDGLELITRGGHPDLDKLYSIAYVLHEQSDLLRRLERLEDSTISQVKAFHYYVLWHRLSEDQDRLPQAEELFEELKSYQLPDELMEESALYWERVQQFAVAEDIWFHLLEQQQSKKPDKVLQFYNRIEQLPDEALDLGNLPRAEIQQGRDTLNKRYIEKGK